MNMGKTKGALCALSFTLSLSSYATPHLLWDNQEGLISAQNCSISELKEINLRASRYYGRGHKDTENLRNYNGVRQSHLVNSSIVKFVEGKSKRNYKKVEIVGVNSNTSARVNRWFSERGDSGYLYHESILPMEDFVFKISKDHKAFSSDVVKENIALNENEDIYLRIAADSSYYKLECEGKEARDYIIFRGYQKDHSDEPLFLLGVSEQETSLLSDIHSIGKLQAKSIIADVGNEEIFSLGAVADNTTSEELVEQTDITDDIAQQEIAIEEKESEVATSEESISNSDSELAPEISVIPQARPDDLIANATSSLQQVVCIGTSTLNVRDESLDKVLFKAKLGEEVKVFQSWDGEELSKVIGGVTYNFLKVQFSSREEEDEKVGYVASSFVKSESDCRYLENGKPVRNSSTQISGIDDTKCCDFPTMEKPTHSYTSGMRMFGSNRSSGERKHAACDLYRYKDEPIKSIAPGVVIRDLYYFYQGTYALEVKHSGGFIARYGEMTSFKAANVRKGRTLSMGQRIGRMGKVNSNCCRPMLHFELYKGNASGSLSTSSGKYRRRSDLMNPTTYLKKWESEVF